MPDSMVGGNRVTLLHDGEQALPAMLAAIEAARTEILLEMYWFASDATGQRFAHALADKAREGVRVLVTYDAVGSFETSRAMFRELMDAGCGVFEYNPVRFPRLSFVRLNRRNHRKMLVVDGCVAFTGGLNLGDEWAPLAEGGIFRDDMICIEGPAATPMRTIFLSTYRGRGGHTARANPPPLSANVGDTPVRVLANDRWRHRRLIERAYLERIRAARERILITNSYFIPQRLVRHALVQAVRRGVDVRVLLPVESDVPAVAYATRRLYDYLLRHGIQIFEWGQSILHSKTATVDGTWCTVGTHNLDYRSLAYNLEINVTVDDAEVARRLEARMLADMERSVPVDLTAWRYRSLSQRLLEELFYRMRRLM